MYLSTHALCFGSLQLRPPIDLGHWRRTHVKFRFNSVADFDTSIPLQSHRCSSLNSHVTRRTESVKLGMVRNVDLPEAVVFYGVESVFEFDLLSSERNSIGNAENDKAYYVNLRPGLERILNECREVGTAVLILVEADNVWEDELKDHFRQSAGSRRHAESKQSLNRNSCLVKQLEGGDPPISFRCINSPFVPASNAHLDDIMPESIENSFYNLLLNGKSPSPAFLLDSLQSVQINPRGFGGSSGFGRGQWIEPRRSPIPARTVVFIAGDWIINNQHQMANYATPWLSVSSVRDRCNASRAAGCRVIYLEQPPSGDTLQHVTTQDDTSAMSLCDAVVTTYGNDNIRDIVQPITLDSISTPGDYWLNPPCPKDDDGNRVNADEVVDLWRNQRVTGKTFDFVKRELTLENDHNIVDDELLTDEELESILSELDTHR